MKILISMSMYDHWRLKAEMISTPINFKDYLKLEITPYTTK